ncbi:MAG: sulfur carrier protein ThiS [Cyanobacteriota bacterium]|nr:sulfur carrier protein ThiS [Cyanobacteriota bacterium]
MIQIRVNGEQRSCPEGLDLREVLIHLGYQPAVVVVELNGLILSRSQWPGRRVVESDVLEVVTIVGGGA